MSEMSEKQGSKKPLMIEVDKDLKNADWPKRTDDTKFGPKPKPKPKGKK